MGLARIDFRNFKQHPMQLNLDLADTEQPSSLAALAAVERLTPQGNVEARRAIEEIDAATNRSAIRFGYRV
jgi:hypothetical protein